MNRQRKLFSFHPEMALFRNPPVEDIEGGEADKSLRVPCEIRGLFLWGQSAESLVPA
jgi:hypothetical protein